MAIFDFRLQHVLDYRQMQEQWAKDAYMEARAARVEGEAALQAIRDQRGTLLQDTPSDLESRRALEATLLHLDDRERAQNQVLLVLSNEETNALAAWQNQKRELETLVRLRESAHKEWSVEEDRRQQAELDEWAVLRHSA